MKIIKNFIQEKYHKIKKDEPGQRFVNYYKKRQQKQQGNLVLKVFYIVIGILLIITGVIFGFLPGPGFVFVLTGLGLIGSQLKFFALILDKGEIKLRHWLRKLKRNSSS
ncbi:hypothetical protein GF312_14500 [Candidatus Poribacteria bacterium]|nr:hypothetical protein [Candidatus Poribacteria bacterium]